MLTAIVRSDLRPVSAGKSSLRVDEELGLDVGGLTTTTWEHLRWKTPRLRNGDEILIKIVEADAPDRPGSRERARTDEPVRAERKYVERAANGKRIPCKVRVLSTCSACR